MNIKTPLVTSMIQSSVAAPGSHALILASRGRKARQSVSLWLLLKGVEHMPLETPQIREERAAEQLSVYSSSLFSLSNMPSPTYMSQKYFQLTLCHGIPRATSIFTHLPGEGSRKSLHFLHPHLEVQGLCRRAIPLVGLDLLMQCLHSIAKLRGITHSI